MKLSVGVTFGVLVAEDAAAPIVVLIAVRALVSPVCSVFGSLALKYWPRPFTAACQRSSSAVGLSATGCGQLQMEAVPPGENEQPVAPVRICWKSPLIAVS